jgi:diguanylate cyclase (GGDEF)-like protein
MIEKAITQFDNFISRLPRYILLPIIIIIVIALGVLDYLTGSEISISLFFFFPIAITTWYLGLFSGTFFAIFATLMWEAAEMVRGASYSNQFAHDWNVGMRLIYYLLVVLVAYALKTVFEKNRLLATTDSLTGLLNSREFYRLAALETLRSQRNKQSVTVAFLDLDNFKAINDRYGHLVGDELIKLVSQSISGSLRRTDLLARVGGDEFAILLPDTTTRMAEQVARKIQDALTTAMQEHGYLVTFSLGALTFSSPPLDFHEALSQADALMYQVKLRGKNDFLIVDYEKDGFLIVDHEKEVPHDH